MLCISEPSNRTALAKTAGVFHDHLEDRADVRRRARDHPQDLAGGGLLLEGLGELTVLGLQLVEQPGVLDGDGRLVREGLHQGDLAVGERPDLRSVDDDHSQELVRSEHGDPEDGPIGVHVP
jgi:hypothetical protein